MTLEKTETVKKQTRGVGGDRDIVPLTVGLLVAMEGWICVGKCGGRGIQVEGFSLAMELVWDTSPWAGAGAASLLLISILTAFSLEGEHTR